MMPISYLRDRFFYPHHTPMKDTCNMLVGVSSVPCLVCTIVLEPVGDFTEVAWIHHMDSAMSSYFLAVP